VNVLVNSLFFIYHDFYLFASRRLPEYLEGRTPKEKTLLAFLVWRGWNFFWKRKGCFSFGVAAESARRWRGDSRSVRFSFKPPRAPRVHIGFGC